MIISLDISVANCGDDTVSVLLGKDKINFRKSATYTVGISSASAVVSGDFNNDMKIDLAVSDKWSKTINALRGYGNGSFKTVWYCNIGDKPHDMMTVDFNNDIYLDLIIANYLTNTVGVLLGNESETFQLQKNYSTGYKPLSIIFGDLNNDRKGDLVVTNSISQDLSVFLNVYQ
ncbi:unnamed protein product [Rotaria socialis]|uniref:VCBS repeat-containing protein n=1 Tax=Rotaria socialis TaxID=392032 RepID=A0A818YPL4_9BILA|nr:unnamed protein product [Rotaria socialis]CAF4284905.1 unnamed protein product [Rotaria socialis]